MAVALVFSFSAGETVGDTSPVSSSASDALLRQPRPLGVIVASGFFVLAGFVEVLTLAADMEAPAFWPIWDAVFRGVPHFVLAYGLYQRIALCRSIAMVYCLAVLITYVVVLGMALFQAPVEFPRSIVLQSLFHIPSCALLFPYLRRPEATRLFPRPLFAPKKRANPSSKACSGNDASL